VSGGRASGENEAHGGDVVGLALSGAKVARSLCGRHEVSRAFEDHSIATLVTLTLRVWRMEVSGVAESDWDPDPNTHRQLLDPSESVHVEARADDALVLVTDKRLAVASRPDRFDLDIPYDGLRRVQFDIERTRPAVLVIVPEHPTDRPQVLSIPPEQYELVGQALAIIGKRLFRRVDDPTQTADTDMDPVGDDGQVFGG
jgi:hypothetical protein